jgi:hypothetical protein
VNSFTKILGCFIALSLLISCGRSLSKGEYISWVQNSDNGLHVTKEVNRITFDVQFLPSDFIALQRAVQNIGPPAKDGSPLKQLTLKIGVADGGDILNYDVSNQSEQQQRLYYFSYLFQEDIYLERAGNKMPCVLNHFEKSMDSKNYRTFHLMFEDSNDDLSDEFDLVIESDRLSSLPIRFKIRIDNIPQVSGL